MKHDSPMSDGEAQVVPIDYFHAENQVSGDDIGLV